MINYSDAIISYGNNYRLKKAISSSKNGKRVTIGFIGASVTAEPFDPSLFTRNYVSMFCEDFNKKYGPVKCINAGLCGSSSIIGLYRIQKEIISFVPDIVFIDFGINDYANPDLMECYEGLLRKLLNCSGQPAVIPIYMSLQSFVNSQAQKIPYGKHYDLTMISIRDILKKNIDSGIFKWSDYSTDYGHPHNNGQRFITDCINYCFENVDHAPSDKGYTVPIPLKTSVYENINVTSEIDVTITENDVFEKELVCCRFILFYYLNNQLKYGAAEILIDGKTLCTLQSYNSTAWGNLESAIIFKSEKPQKHKFTIKMLACDKNKIFAIDGFGYC